MISKRNNVRINLLKYRHKWMYKTGFYTPIEEGETPLWHDSMTREEAAKKRLRAR